MARLGIVILSVSLLAGSTAAEEGPVPAVNAASVGARSVRIPLGGMRAFPQVVMDGGRHADYVGSYVSDGSFRRVSKFGHMMDGMMSASVPYEALDAADMKVPPEFTADQDRGTDDQPEVFNLRSNRRVVYDVAPPGRYVEAVKPKSVFRQTYEGVANAVRGTEVVLTDPHAVTTDSKGRTIIADPEASAVHVLDADPAKSFHIVGGRGRRLRVPVGVAVDGQDNIYVSDGGSGLIQVYDPNGVYRRNIGIVNGETYFQRPTGLAIDRAAGRIYLLDTAIHSLFILDLNGRVIHRIGKRGGGRGTGEFKSPTSVAVRGGEIFVLDSNGSRLQILDSEGRPKSEFSVIPPSRKRPPLAPGLSVDSESRIYVGATASDDVKVYRRDGTLMAVLGRRGERVGEFSGISGLWIDANDRLFVADSDNHRVQVYQLHAGR